MLNNEFKRYSMSKSNAFQIIQPWCDDLFVFQQLPQESVLDGPEPHQDGKWHEEDVLWAVSLLHPTVLHEEGRDHYRLSGEAVPQRVRPSLSRNRPEQEVATGTITTLLLSFSNKIAIEDHHLVPNIKHWEGSASQDS